MRFGPLSRFVCGALAGASILCGGSPALGRGMTLDIIRVDCPGFEDPLPGSLKEMLKAASATFKEKFGLELDLRFRSYMDSDRLFAKAEDSVVLAKARAQRLDPDLVPSPEVRAGAVDFLKSFQPSELQPFFPEQNPAPDPGGMADLLLGRMAEKMKKFSALTSVKDRSSVLAWMAACFTEGQAEGYVTNAPLLYDNPLRPHPHAVLGPGTLGGSSLEVRLDKPGLGRGVLVSTFWASEQARPWMGSLLRDMSPAERARTLGRWLLAHELGHALLKIPDVYDHPDSCLMKTSREDLSLASGLDRLRRNPGPCPACEPYLKMMKEVWKAEEFREKKLWPEAEEAYGRALALAPERLEGGPAFPSKLRLRLVDACLAQDKTKPALLHIEEFIRLNPDNQEALQIRGELSGILREEEEK